MRQRIKILVVESAPTWRARICTLLSQRGYGVYECWNPDQMIPLIRKLRPDLVLLDVGIRAIKLRQVITLVYGERLSKVVLMTHHINRDFMAYQKHNPVDLYVCKAKLESSLEVVLHKMLGSQANGTEDIKANETAVITEAKEKLMAHYQISEAAAYGWMRKKSMDTSTKLIRLAEAILKSIQ